jgi:hypothetical protein
VDVLSWSLLKQNIAVFGRARIITPYGPARAKIYYDLQVAVVQDVPSFPISQPIGRHFEVDWVNGWYYNPVYPGYYYYTLWKWYYIPEARYDTTWNNINQPNSTYLPADLTYDGKVQTDDVAAAAKAFGSNPNSARWMFRADITGDRKIQIDDVAYISKQFGKKGQPTWLPHASISPASATLNVTESESQIFSSTVTGATLPVSYQWYDNTTGPYLPVSGETGSTYTFTPTTSGVYGVYLVATDSSSISVQSGTSIVTAVS